MSLGYRTVYVRLGDSSMKFRRFVSSSFCTIVLCSGVSAQEVKPNQTVLPQQPIANQGPGKAAANALITPQQLAACWALDNQEEIALAKFAVEKSNNKDVADFAKMISEEHQSCLKKLSKFAPDASREGYLTENERNSEKSDAVLSQSPTARGSTAGIDMTQLQREIAQQCVADSKKYLNGKDEAEFDKCFVGMQIGKHAAMHTKLVVLQRHVGPEMQPMVSEGIQAIVKHMKAAESLMEKLDTLDAKVASK
jgi:predicted outer membrane protein